MNVLFCIVELEIGSIQVLLYRPPIIVNERRSLCASFSDTPPRYSIKEYRILRQDRVLDGNKLDHTELPSTKHNTKSHSTKLTNCEFATTFYGLFPFVSLHHWIASCIISTHTCAFLCLYPIRRPSSFSLLLIRIAPSTLTVLYRANAAG